MSQLDKIERLSFLSGIASTTVLWVNCGVPSDSRKNNMKAWPSNDFCFANGNCVAAFRG